MKYFTSDDAEVLSMQLGVELLISVPDDYVLVVDYCLWCLLIIGGYDYKSMSRLI
jgi:hypothetical protein